MRPCVPVHERTISGLEKINFFCRCLGLCALESPDQLINRFLLSFLVYICIFPINFPGISGEKGKRKANVSRCAPTEQHRKTRIVYFYELMRSFIHHSHCVFTGRRGKLIWKFNYERRQSISSRKKDPSELFNPYQLTRMIDSSRFHMIFGE